MVVEESASGDLSNSETVSLISNEPSPVMSDDVVSMSDVSLHLESLVTIDVREHPEVDPTCQMHLVASDEKAIPPSSVSSPPNTLHNNNNNNNNSKALKIDDGPWDPGLLFFYLIHL